MDEYSTVQLPDDSTSVLTGKLPSCDPIAALKSLQENGQPFGVDIVDDIFDGSRIARYQEFSNASFTTHNTPDNHLQGIQRIGDTLLLTGADWSEPAAHLFIVPLELTPDGQLRGKLTRVLALDTTLPHAGGFQCLGNVAPIPLEGENKKISRVIFLDVSNPLSPSFISGNDGARLIIQRTNPKASATALARLDDDRYLLGVYHKGSKLDLYLSRSGALRDGFHDALVSLSFPKVQKKTPDYQSIYFVQLAQQQNGEVRVWMMGLRSTGKFSNYKSGSNLVDLASFDVPASLLASWTAATLTPAVHETKRFFFEEDAGNFAASASIEIQTGGRVTLYSAHHWRVGRQLKLSICQPHLIV